MLEYLANDDQPNFTMVASDAINYTAISALSDYVQGIADENSRYGAMLGVGEDLDGTTYINSNNGGFGGGIVLVIRLNISKKDIIDNITNTLPSGDNLKLFPNPANSTLHITLDLIEMEKEGIIKIYDLSGRLLVEKSFINIKYEKIKFDLTKFVSGIYYLHFVTDIDSKTEHFVVQH